MQENELSGAKEKLIEIFISLFKKEGYLSSDSFGFDVFFIQNNIKKGISPKDYFEEILTSTPNPDDDIIKIILIKYFSKSTKTNIKENRCKIYVLDFINEITKEINTLFNEKLKVEKHITEFDAYENIIKLEQQIKNFDIYWDRGKELDKSTVNICISKVSNLRNGDYQFSLFTSQFKNNKSYEKSNSSITDDINNLNYLQSKEIEVFEHKLNNIITISNYDYNSDNDKKDEYDKNTNTHMYIIGQYAFPEISFYWRDSNNLNSLNNLTNISLSGIDKNYNENENEDTNLSHFQIKMENLSLKDYDNDCVFSDTYKIIELLITNCHNLVNNFDKIKILNANIKLQNEYYNTNIGLKIKIEFDPLTLMSIYRKILKTMKYLISYQIILQSKINKILSYFNEISDNIKDIYYPKEENKNKCIII